MISHPTRFISITVYDTQLTQSDGHQLIVVGVDLPLVDVPAHQLVEPLDVEHVLVDVLNGKVALVQQLYQVVVVEADDLVLYIIIIALSIEVRASSWSFVYIDR